MKKLARETPFRQWSEYWKDSYKSMAIGAVLQFSLVGAFVIFARALPARGADVPTVYWIQTSWSWVALAGPLFVFNLQNVVDRLGIRLLSGARVWIFAGPVASTLISLSDGWPQRIQLWISVCASILLVLSRRT